MPTDSTWSSACRECQPGFAAGMPGCGRLGRRDRRGGRAGLGRSYGRVGAAARLPAADAPAGAAVPAAGLRRPALPARRGRRPDPGAALRGLPVTLDRVPVGGRAVVEAVGGDGALAQRLMEFGLLEGETVEVVGVAPLGDPIELRVGDTRLSLRRREAASVTVRRLEP